jgi:hypothetical protein
MFLKGSFIIEDRWENQAQDGWSPSGVTHRITGVRGWRTRTDSRGEGRRLKREVRNTNIDRRMGGIVCCVVTCAHTHTHIYIYIYIYMAIYQITP